jgi:hypothetical protein
VVGDGGQLYTIEGLAAGLIMIATAYIVLGSTIVYTPGDTHIADMQLETLGSDVLRMMDTPVQEGVPSYLNTSITNNDAALFRDTFLAYCNAATRGVPDNLQFSANITYSDVNGGVDQYYLASSRTMTGREHAVRVSRWVYLPGKPGAGSPADMRPGSQMVLVEVLLWRT